MILEYPNLPPFEPILRRLFDHAQRHGSSVLEERRHTQADFEGNPSVRRKFLRACHYGYDLAQRKIAKLVIEMEEEVARLTVALKEFRRERNPEAKNVLHKIHVVKNRQLALRRLVDSVLYAMIQQQNWLLRRLTVDLTIHNIDPVVLDRTVQVAVERNRDDRMKFNLVTDLSTVVQIGDLIEIDLSADGARKWRVIELKEGKVNELLSGLIEQHKLKPTIDVIDTVKKTMGDKAAKQAHRMIKQVRRVGELERIVDTDRGLDPLYEVETLMTPDTLALDNYYGELAKVYNRAKQRGEAALELNGCLRIFGVSLEKSKGRGRRAALHQFFHMANPGRSCAFSGNSATDQNQEAEMLKHVPHFVDIADYNLHVSTADPIFAWPYAEMIFDLVMGRIQLFVQLDYEALFRFAMSHNIKIRWSKGKEAEEVKKFSMRLRGTDSWAALAELPDGKRVTLLAGFLSRIYANCATPLQMIDMIKTIPKQLAKADPDETLELV